MVGNQPRKIEDFGDLTWAERKILEELDTGEMTIVGEEVPSDFVSDHKLVRARFLRWVVLGCEGSSEYRIHENGVAVRGALISGEGPHRIEHARLDLGVISINSDVMLTNCRFRRPPNFMDTRLQGLFLVGSHLPGFLGDRLSARCSVCFDESEVNGEILLNNASVGGNLTFTNAKFRNSDGQTVSAEGLSVRTRVDFSNVISHGEIRLIGAQVGDSLVVNCAKMYGESNEVISLSADRIKVGGNISLADSTIHGEIRLLGGYVQGNLDCHGSRFSNAGRDCLSAQGASIQGRIFLNGGVKMNGRLDVSGSDIGYICDDIEFWKSCEVISLFQCQYRGFSGSSVNPDRRLEWLSKEEGTISANIPFRPQPYEQCAKVLREMGYRHDAECVLMKLETLKHASHRKGRIFFLQCISYVWSQFFRLTIGYGYRPSRVIPCAVVLWISIAIVVYVLKFVGIFAYEEGEEGQIFSMFGSLVFSLDVLLPFVNISQEMSLKPNNDHPFVWIANSIVILGNVFGLILSAILVASSSGIVKIGRGLLRVSDMAR